MKRILNLIFAAVAIVSIVSSCQKDDIDDYGVDGDGVSGYGSDLVIYMPTDFSDTIPLESITCEIRTSTPELRFITATHTLVDGKSTFLLDEPLPTGSNVLRAVRYTGLSTGTRVNDYSEVMMGCIVKVLDYENITTPSTYNKTYNFFGSGTNTDPFLIGSALGFANINNMDRTDYYFKQIDSIDFLRYYGHENGFEGVCPDYNKPFKGYFQGGADSAYMISNLAVRRYSDEQNNVDTWGSVNPAALFCCVSGAVIEKVIIDNPHIIGNEAVGGVVGVVLGGSGDSTTSTIVNECKLIRTLENDNKIFGTSCVGGIIGAIEYEGNAIVSNCSVAKELIIQAHNAAAGGNYLGGIVGASGSYATLAISNCENNAPLEGDGITNIGGVVGSGQTIKMINCINNADITLLNGTDNTIAIGGLIGGCTDATVSGSTNKGAIKGTRGVGGLLGSALVDSGTDPNTYGSVSITSSHNYGDILGTQGVGGLVGEGQVAVVNSLNTGSVGTHSVSGATYKDAEVGGLVGFASMLVASGSHNAGAVDGVYSGGISGIAEYFFTYASTNFGAINGSYTGGIIGKTCEYGIINYCSNFADITGSGSLGGVVGVLGDHLSTADKTASYLDDLKEAAVIFLCKAVFELGGTVGEYYLSHTFFRDASGKVVDTAAKKSTIGEIVGCVPMIMDFIEMGLAIWEEVEVSKELKERTEEVEEFEEDAETEDEESEKTDLNENIEKLRDQWSTAVSDGMDTMNSALSTKLDGLIGEEQYKYRGDMPLTQNITKATLDNIRSFATAIDNDTTNASKIDNTLTNNVVGSLGGLAEQIIKTRKIEEAFACIEKCAVAIASIATGVCIDKVAKNMTEKIIGKVCLVVAGSAGSIAVSAQSEYTEDADNTIIMNQCSNFGAVSGNGIVGEIGDRVLIKNILSAGKVTGYGVANDADGKNLYDANIISIGTQDTRIYPDKVIDSPDNTNIFVFGDGTDGTLTEAEMKTKSTYGDDTCDDDYDWSWSLWNMNDGDEIPTFANSMYFEFM